MYFRLKEPWAFRGWKKLPYALRAEYGKHEFDDPAFLTKDIFMDLLHCNGEEDIDLSSFSERGRQSVEDLLKQGYMEQSETPMEPLQGWQRYHLFQSRYIGRVHWSITGKCNFNCRHCLVSAPDAHHPQLPLEDCIRIIHEIAKCGVKSVDITGGEPLVRADFEDIVKELSKCGIHIETLFTNAALLNRELLDMLKVNGQHPGFQLSFDGYGHHDWLRGVPGAEKMADKAFRLLKEYDFPVCAAMCIHKENRDSLRATANYLAGYGVKSLRVNAPQDLGNWSKNASEYALSEDEVWETYKEYIGHYFEDGMPIDVELDGYFKGNKGRTTYEIMYVHHPQSDNWHIYPYCESVKKSAYIGPDGRVCPCMGFSSTALNDKFPSVLEQSLGSILIDSLYNDVADTRASQFLEHNPECQTCDKFKACMGGCMLADTTEEGDYLVPDKRCCYFHKHIGAEAVRAVVDEAIRNWYNPNYGS